MRLVESPESGADGSLAARRPDRPTLLYDDGCRFCRAMAETLCHFARRRELGFLPWSNGIAEAWLGGLEPGARDVSMHLKLPDGTLMSGTGVLGATLASVRGLKWMAWLAENVPGAGRLLAWQYGLVAGHRGCLSRFVPDRPAVIHQPGLR
jgi:predicted DCC family thiol-disulfide oxidoreductase YuxK